MAEITNTTNDLIIRAYQMIGAFNYDEAPGQCKISEGIYYLNEMLDFFSADGLFIPFREDLTFSLVAGQPDYVFGYDPLATIVDSRKVINLDYCTVKDTVANGVTDYPVDIADINMYKFFGHNESVTTRPRLVRLQESPEYSTLIFRETPDKAYSCTISAKFILSHLSAQQPLDTVPAYYQKFLRYALARELSDIMQSSSWTGKQEGEYMKMRDVISSSNDLDLRARTRTRLGSYNYYRGQEYGDYFL